jgi:hypothetical protein
LFLDLSLIDLVSAANAGHASPYTEEKYGGYGQLLESLLKEPGEDWEKFVVLEGKFPSAEQLAKVSTRCLPLETLEVSILCEVADEQYEVV